MREKSKRRTELEMFLIPRNRSIASGPPMMLLRMVNASIKHGYYKHLANVVAKHPHKITLPESALEEVEKLAKPGPSKQRSSNKTKHGRRPVARSETIRWKQTTLRRLLEVVRSSIENGSYTELQSIARHYGKHIHIEMPRSVANDWKRLLHKYLASGKWGDLTTGRLVLKSKCGGGGSSEPTNYVCRTAEGQVICRNCSRRYCEDIVGGKYVPER